MEAKLRATFEGLPLAKPNPARHEVFHGPTPGVYFIDKEDVNQSHVEIVGLGIERRNPGCARVGDDERVLAEGLRAGCSRKCALSWDWPTKWAAGWRWLGSSGDVSGVVLTKSATTVEAVQQTYKVLDGLTTQPFTEDELKRAKDNILNSFLFRYDTKDKVLAERVRLEFYGYPADYLETYKAALEKVTRRRSECAQRRSTFIPTSTRCSWLAMVRRSSPAWMN